MMIGLDTGLATTLGQAVILNKWSQFNPKEISIKINKKSVLYIYINKQVYHLLQVKGKKTVKSSTT